MLGAITGDMAEKFTLPTHGHPKGIKEATATASAIFLGRTGHSKEQIKEYVIHQFGYNLNQTCDEIRPTYYFNESCADTVPQAMVVFLDSTDFEHAIRLAISFGGDSDTLACITGGIAQAFYGGVPEFIATQSLSYLDADLRAITEQFMTKYALV